MLIEDEVIVNQNYEIDPFVKGNYEYCVFKQCRFVAIDLSDTSFMECEFVECDLSNAKLAGTAFRDVKFSHCKLLGLDFDACHTFGFEVSFDHCFLSHSSFFKVALNNSSFLDCELVGVDFTEANLKKSMMTGCDLNQAVFDRTHLEQADMQESFNFFIDPEVNHIKGLKVSASSLSGFLLKYGLKIK